MERPAFLGPVLGGTPRRLGDLRIGNLGFGGAWSPDGATIVYGIMLTTFSYWQNL